MVKDLLKVVGVVILLCICCCVCYWTILSMGICKNISSDDKLLIISFIGILATFVVVNNFGQINSIKEDNREWRDCILERIGNVEKDQEEVRNEIKRVKLRKEEGLSSRVATDVIAETLEQYESSADIKNFRNLRAKIEAKVIKVQEEPKED